MDTALGLAIATHSLLPSMQRTEDTRILERAEDKSTESLIQNLSPRQQALFTELCTDHVHRESVMPAYLTACLAEKAPHRATNLTAQGAQKWKGC